MKRALAVLLAGLLAPGAARAEECADLRRLDAGVYLRAAAGAVPTPENGGRTGNSTVLVGPQGVVVIDPGPTQRAGLALRCGIGRLTPLPVVALVNTHAHPQHVLANGAFPGAVVWATAATADSMRERCAHCRERLAAQIGGAGMTGTEPVLPGRTIEVATPVTPGGRALLLLPLGRAHAQGDLAVLDQASGTLVAGDLANAVDLPEFADGSLAGAIAALEALRGRDDVRLVIPGRGEPTAPDRLDRPLAYLKALAAVAAREVAAGNITPPAETPPELRPWGEDPRRHSLNLQQALREAEAAWWAAPPARP